MLTKFCQVPASEVNVCPSFGWAQDFSDPQTVIDPNFDGKLILKVSNVNWSELDDPSVNSAIEKAKATVEPDARAQAWAEANKQIVAQAAAIPYMWDYQSAVDVPQRPRSAEQVLHDVGLELHVPALISWSAGASSSVRGPAPATMRERAPRS